LATVGPDGEPQAADLYYAETDDLTLYFISAAGSRHAANVARDPRVAATVHADSTHWRDIRGVQLEGTCARITGAERAKAWARYTAKFPFILTDVALTRVPEESLILYSFETAGELSEWEFGNTISRSRVTDHATHGSRSLKIGSAGKSSGHPSPQRVVRVARRFSDAPTVTTFLAVPGLPMESGSR